MTRAASPAALFGGELNTFDRTAERLRLGFGDRLSGEELVERVGQVVARHLRRFRRVIDPAVVEELAVLADDVDLRRVGSAVEVRDLVAGILEDREREPVLLGVRRRLLDAL